MAETQLSHNDQYRARPTVRLNDQKNDRVSALINAFKVTEHEGGLSALELHLVNFTTPKGGGDDALALEDERDLKLGTRLKLYAGDESQPREIFRGVVSGIEADFPESGPPEIVVLAEDAMMLARLQRRSKVHDKLTLKKLAGDVASHMSLTPKVTGLADDLGTQVQLNESDLAFLRRLLHRVDADVQVVGTELHVSPRKDVARGTVELALHSQLFSAHFHVDLADQVSEVTTTGWDVKKGLRVAAASKGAHLGPGKGRRGAQLLEDALGKRSEHVGSLTVCNDTEARALADAAFDQRARRFVRASGVADGNALIRVGTHVKISGTSRRFDNTYYVTQVRHRYERQLQYVTEFEAECAFLGMP